jgi:hypothetical protein
VHLTAVKRTISTTTAVLAGLAVLAGCGSSGSPAVQPAPDAAQPACAQLTGRLPDRVLNQARNQLAVTGAATWGDPAIVLRCGVPPTGPTSDPCLEADGLDWVFTETKNQFRFVTFGRTPAVEVQIPSTVDRTAASGALVDLADAVRPLKSSKTCT